MTVVEVESPVWVESPEEALRNRRASLLDAAALELAVRGWTQGEPCDEEGRVCLMGAIDATLPTAPMDWRAVMFTWDPDWRLQWPEQPEGGLLPIASWNDDPGRGVGEVQFLLRWRAEEIRDGF